MQAQAQPWGIARKTRKRGSSGQTFSLRAVSGFHTSVTLKSPARTGSSSPKHWTAKRHHWHHQCLQKPVQVVQLPHQNLKQWGQGHRAQSRHQSNWPPRRPRSSADGDGRHWASKHQWWIWCPASHSSKQGKCPPWCECSSWTQAEILLQVSCKGQPWSHGTISKSHTSMAGNLHVWRQSPQGCGPGTAQGPRDSQLWQAEAILSLPLGWYSAWWPSVGQVCMAQQSSDSVSAITPSKQNFGFKPSGHPPDFLILLPILFKADCCGAVAMPLGWCPKSKMPRLEVVGVELPKELRPSTASLILPTWRLLKLWAPASPVKMNEDWARHFNQCRRGRGSTSWFLCPD